MSPKLTWFLLGAGAASLVWLAVITNLGNQILSALFGLR